MPQQYHELLVGMDHAFRKYQAEYFELFVVVCDSTVLATKIKAIDVKYEAIFVKIYRQLREWNRIETMQLAGSHRTMPQPSRNEPSVISASRPQRHAVTYENRGQAPVLSDMVSARPQCARPQCPQSQMPVLVDHVRRPSTSQIESAPIMSQNHVATPLYPQGTQGQGTHSTPRTFILPSSKVEFYARQGVAGAQITPSEPHRFALHQAHLRSPTLRVVMPEVISANSQPLYQFVSDLALAIQDIDNLNPVQAWEFTIAEPDFSAIPQENVSERGKPLVRHVNTSSRMFRLRCAKADARTPMGQWVVAETSWPTDLYFMINGNRLQPRRKLHNGRDLPIDITSYIMAGSNTVKAFSNRRKDIPSPQHAVAVEIIELKQHDEIKADCMKRVIPAAETKRTLVKSLTSHHNNNTPDGGADDDDIMILSNTLMVSLLDPFLASCIWEVPVRGSSCTHRECWDLETWLETRHSGDLDVPSAIDNWKCPICKGDGRPNSLVVDEWMMLVKDDLRRRDLLKTRAIIVAEDGSWTIKDEQSNRGTTGERAMEVQTCGPTLPPRSTESPVVDLDGLDVI